MDREHESDDAEKNWMKNPDLLISMGSTIKFQIQVKLGRIFREHDHLRFDGLIGFFWVEISILLFNISIKVEINYSY